MINLQIGSSNPPVEMSIRQSALTSASETLRHHLRAQVPNEEQYRTRDKTMKMRNESPSTVSRFLQFIKSKRYDVGTIGGEVEAIRIHLRMYIFAVKYQATKLAKYSRAKAGAVLQGLVVADAADIDITSADLREEEGSGGNKAWENVCRKVIAGAEDREVRAIRTVLVKLIAPYVWRNSREW